MTASVALRPLQCMGCGAVLPLGEAKDARCRFCSTDTPIPEEYLALQRSAKSFAADKQFGAQLYGQVGKPPGWFLRTWGRGAQSSAGIFGGVVMLLGGIFMIHPVIGFFMIVALAYGLGYPFAFLVRGVAWVVGYPLGEKLSPFPIVFGAALFSVLMIGFPSVLFEKERKLGRVRTDIHASLAAGLPERPGGPSRCRSCGAALDVPSGALGVPCTYCKADNLVALPEMWVKRVQSSEFHHFLKIDAALDAYREASRVANEKLWGMMAALALSFPGVLLLAYVLDRAGFWF